jgi:predicted dehydrogenase
LVNAENIFDVTKKIIPFKIPIFLEKPPGISLSETMTLYRLSKKYHTKNMVGLNRRFYSLFHKGINIIKKHGKLLGILIEGHERFWKIKNKSRKLFKKWIYANSIHVIDLFRFFAGNTKKVYSIKNILPNNNNQYSSTIKFKNGVVGTYISHWFSPDGWSVTLYGNKVTVKFRPLEKGYWINDKFVKHKLNLSQEDKFFKPGFYNQMICFKNLIRKKKLKWPGQSLKDAVLTMKLIKQINKE